MGLWSVIVPEATTNMVTNPSFEGSAGVTGWIASGGTITAQSSPGFVQRPAVSTYVCQVNPGTAVNNGMYGGTVSLTSGTAYTFTAYLYGAVGMPYTGYFATTAGASKGTPGTITGTGDWQRLTATFTADSSTNFRLYVTKNNSNNAALFYVDCCQVEAKSYATTYCDGYQTGCSWNGVANASTSTRSATTRAGGRSRDLTSVYSLTVLNATGIGAPPVSNYISEYALLPGGLHQNAKIRPRVMILNCVLNGTTLANLHSLRNSLYALFEPSDTKGPVILQYTGSGSTMKIVGHYDGGMDGGVIERNIERLGLRFVCPNPDWEKVY